MTKKRAAAVKTKMSWWDGLWEVHDNHFQLDLDEMKNVIENHIICRTPFGEGGRLYTINLRGRFRKGTDPIAVFRQLVPSAREIQAQKEKGDYLTFSWSNGVMQIIPRGGSATGYVIVRNEAETAFALDVEKTMQKLCTSRREPARTCVTMIVPSLGGLATRSIPIQDVKFEEGNYATEVIDGVNRIREDLQVATPSGRFSILDGPPGTGKTHIVRSLLKAPINGHTIIVPPHATASLQDPAFAELLLNMRGSFAGPIFLVIEDADQCLAARKAENMSAISTILNLTDGILGTALDLRVLATTNTSKTEFDEALLRPGRLSAHVHVGRLDREHAQRVYGRLTGGTSTRPVRGNTLAEIYAEAREWNEYVIKKMVVSVPETCTVAS